MAQGLTITAQDIHAARAAIAGAVKTSVCFHSPALSRLTGTTLYAKLDNLQETGSFKERGACYALMTLDPDQQAAGVIAASAGNHALALACHGKRLGIGVTVVMPRFAPLAKVSRCRSYGAAVLLHGESFDQARAHALTLATQQGLCYIHGFNDPAIIAGQGTVGLELLEQVQDLDAVIVPVGGGGLLAGVAVAIKAARPQVRIIGVEPMRAASLSAALAAGQPVSIDLQPTLADGLAVGCVGDRAFACLREHLDEMVTVDESEIALAIVRLMELEKTVVEGAGATSLAALLGERLAALRGKRVAILLCGGNIDMNVLDRIIEFGLVTDGRLGRLTVTISDRPGGLAGLTRCIAEAGASVRQIEHDRTFAGPDVASVRVMCVIETIDAGHRKAVADQLTQAGYPVILETPDKAPAPGDASV